MAPAGYEPREFIDRLRSGSLSTPLRLSGMVRASDENGDSIDLSANCSVWVSIPSSMVEEINLIGVKKCKDHAHNWVSVQLKEPQ